MVHTKARRRPLVDAFRHFLGCTCHCKEKRKVLELTLAQRPPVEESPSASGRIKGVLNPGPSSLPHITRSFTAVRSDSTKTEIIVSYQEFTGFGHPDRNYLTFGEPGDIYISTTPGEHTVYGKTSATEWKVWPGPLMVLNGLSHPAYPEHILFTRESGRFTDVGWVRKRYCKNNCEYL